MREFGKLARVRAMALPTGLLDGLHLDLIGRFRRRAAAETAWELRRHPDRVRLPLLAFYCVPREAEIVDGLIELLIQITQRITVKAEKRVMEELLADATRVRGPRPASCSTSPAPPWPIPTAWCATSSSRSPAGRPSRGWSRKRWRARDGATRASTRWFARPTAPDWRRMLPRLPAAVEFRSNNAAHRPLLDAIAAIRATANEGRQRPEKGGAKVGRGTARNLPGGAA